MILYPDSPCESDPRADVYALGVVMWAEEVQLFVDRATALTRQERL